MQAAAPQGVLLVPVIMYSDGTSLDDLQVYNAHPVYITIGQCM
jgi:hypothetical protein